MTTVSRAAEGRGAVHPAQRLGEARGGVLRGRRRVGEAAIPGRAAAGPALRQSVDHDQRRERGDGDEEGDDRRIVDAARRIEGDQRERRGTAARPGQRAAHELVQHRRQRRCQHAAHEPAQNAQEGEPAHGDLLDKRHVVRAGRFGAARTAEEGRAVDAHEAGGRQRGGQRQHGADGRRGKMQRRLRQGGRGNDGLEQQPLGNEAVERRQGGNGERTHQKEDSGARHAMDEAAQPIEVAPSGGVQDGARAEEQQGLEPGMVEHVQECRRHRHGRRLVLGVGAEGQSEAQRHEDQADILDRRIGQHALEVAVEHRVEQPEHGRHRAQHDGRQRPPPGRAARAGRRRCARSRRSPPWS